MQKENGGKSRRFFWRDAKKSGFGRDPNKYGNGR
jgi:hypothetical protein